MREQGKEKKGDAAGQPVAYSCFPDNVRVMCAAGILWRKGFHGILKMPYGILIIMWICGFLFAGIQAFGIYKRRTNCLRENAIQESLDNLPSGIGFLTGTECRN